MKNKTSAAITAGTLMGAAFLLSSCQRQEAFYSDRTSYYVGSDEAQVILSNVVEGHDIYEENLTRRLEISFEDGEPVADKACIAQIYRIQGDAVFDRSSTLAREYAQAAEPQARPVIQQEFERLEKDGIESGENINWVSTSRIECGQKVIAAFPLEIKQALDLRKEANTGWNRVYFILK